MLAIGWTAALPAAALLGALAAPTQMPPAAAAQNPADLASDSGAVYSGAAGELEVRAPRAPEPSIEIDAVLDEAAWATAAVLTDFTLYEPTEGVASPQPTEVRFVYGPDALYFAARAHDEPGGVRATLAERDEILRNDDWIRILLDTYGDAQRAYAFYVNPLGVQQDGLWIEGYEERGRGGGFGPPIDFNPDFVWSSAGRRTESGYVVELRIPLKSLRFPGSPTQSWGLHLARHVQRSGYESSWAPITGDRANVLAQAGRLVGLEDLERGLFLELNPVMTARVVGRVDEASGEFTRSDPDSEFGLNATYGLTSSLTLDVTYNPDFSQVEADEGQIAVNERFAIFFPEKRPFFLEGTEIFQMPQPLVYTRSIANPLVGAKVTGKLASSNIGYLGALDDPITGDDALFNLLRLRQDFGGGYAGALYADRSVPGEAVFNRVAGADARLRFGERYTLQLLGAGSWDRRGEADDLLAGSLLAAALSRSGRTFSFDAELTDIAPEFRTRSGFIRRTGDAEASVRAEYQRYGEPGDLIEQWGPELQVRRIWDHDAFWGIEPANEGELRGEFRVSLRGNSFINFGAKRVFYRYSAGDYAGLFVPQPGEEPRPFRPADPVFAGWGADLTLFNSTLGWLRGFVRLGWEEQPMFASGRVAPERPGVALAHAYSARLNFTLRPTRALVLETSVAHEELFRQSDGRRHSIATIPRVRAQYQFSRSLFLRLIGEYAAQQAEPLVDPATGRVLVGCADGACAPLDTEIDNIAHVEALLAYEPSPGTVVYAGYARDMQEPERFAFGPLEPRLDGLFLKLSYRYRL